MRVNASWLLSWCRCKGANTARSRLDQTGIATLGAMASDFDSHALSAESDALVQFRFESLEQVRCQFRHSPTGITARVEMISPSPRLVEMLVSLDVQEIQLLYETMLLEQCQCSIDRSPVHMRVTLLGKFLNLCSIEMPAFRLDEIENQAPLVSKPHSAGNQLLSKNAA